MSVQPVELIPRTSIDLAREQFERLGHVGLSGLYDPELGQPAIRDADDLVLRPGPLRVCGEEIANVRRHSKRRQPQLHAVLEGVQQGAELLGRDISPSSLREKRQIQIIRMASNVQGLLHRDRGSLLDVVAITNLAGRSHLWIEDGDGDDGFDYSIEAGDVVIHDLDKKLLHRGYTGPDDQRIGLAIAKH